jgi:apolipoprotein N-acyltransferase
MDAPTKPEPASFAASFAAITLLAAVFRQVAFPPVRPDLPQSYRVSYEIGFGLGAAIFGWMVYRATRKNGSHPILAGWATAAAMVLLSWYGGSPPR